MNSKTAMLAAAVGSLFALRAPAVPAADDPATEKCYGVAKAGKTIVPGLGTCARDLPKRTQTPMSGWPFPEGPASALSEDH